MNTVRIVLLCFLMLGALSSTSADKEKTKKPFILIDRKEVVGLWQGDSKIIASAWGDTYSFRSDGTFTFYVSQFNELSRLVSITGTYRIDSNILKLNIKSRKEHTGGVIERGNPGFEGDWTFRDTKVIEIIQDTKQSNEVYIEWCDTSPKHQCLFMGFRKFYKISSNPNGYK